MGNRRFEVDIDGETVLMDSGTKASLTLSIDDIKTIGKKVNSSTRTIRIPATRAMREKFNHADILGIIDERSPLRYYQNVNIICNGAIVDRGVVYLTRVIMEQGRWAYFEGQFLGQFINFVTKVADKDLSDLMEYDDDIFQFISMEPRMNGDPDVYEWMWTLCDFGNLSLGTFIACNILDFRPDVYARPIVRKIFEDEGYSVTFKGDFVNSEFKKVSCMFDMPLEHDKRWRRDREVRANVPAHLYLGGVGIIPSWIYTVFLNVGTDDDSTAPNFYDPQAWWKLFAWNSTTGTAVARSFWFSGVKRTIDFEIYLEYSFVPDITTQALEMRACIQTDGVTNATPPFVAAVQPMPTGDPVTFKWTGRVEVGANQDFFFQIFGNFGTNAGPVNPLNYINFTTGYVKITPSEILYRAEEFRPPLPESVKRLDFLKSMQGIFDLYYDVDENEKKVVISQRTEYYRLGKKKDWTKKQSSGETWEHQPLANSIARKLKFSYKKDDNDLSHEQVSSSEDWTFGNKIIELGTEVKEATSSQEFAEGNIFAATVMVEGQNTAWLPQIIQDNPISSFVHRIFIHDGQWVRTGGVYLNVDEGTGIIYASPFLSKTYFYLKDMDENDFHLSFENLQDKNSRGQNADIGLVDRLHKALVNIYKFGSLLKKRFDLSTSDIIEMKFSDEIIIDDTEHIINTINSFALTEQDTTEVELIRK